MNSGKILGITLIGSTLIIVFLLYWVFSIQNTPTTPEISNIPNNINLWTIFLTGLITGGLTCLAVQGGLLASTIAQREQEKLKEKIIHTGNAMPIIAFLSTKLIAYTALGFLLGWFGSLFQLSFSAQIVMQVVVIIFMVGTALNILNVHPIFRYFVIQPPKFLTRLVRNQSKSKSLFAPAMLGAFTVVIPCGTTQAMMALSIGSGNPFTGAAVLFAFVLGTSPLFFTLGYFATRLGEKLQQRFMKIAAVSLLLLALFNLNNVLALLGSPVTIESVFANRAPAVENSIKSPVLSKVLIKVIDAGYSPQVVTVKAGTDVTFNIENSGVYSCASAFTIPHFNYQKIVEAGKTETITLKMPDKPTQIPFMCSMGMYRGVINVI